MVKAMQDKEAGVAQSTIFEGECNTKAGLNCPVHISQLNHSVLQDMQSKHLTEIKTGWSALDQELTELSRGELIVVGGSSASGKTAFVVNLAKNVVMDQTLPVIFFSFGETGKQIAQKILCVTAHVDLQALRSSELSETDWANLCGPFNSLADMPLWIVDATKLTVDAMRKHLEDLSKNHAPALIIVDTLHDLCPARIGDTRAGDLSETVRDLKSLAKDFNCTVVVTAKLSRAFMQRPNKRPIPSDILDSSAIEQTADRVILLYRDVLFNAHTENETRVEIHMPKNRTGRTCVFHMNFCAENGRFLSNDFNGEDFLPFH